MEFVVWWIFSEMLLWLLAAVTLNTARYLVVLWQRVSLSTAPNETPSESVDLRAIEC